MGKLISVIVPVYKVENYLDRCVRSILAQTYSDLEIILVDDGSPDNCPAICDEFARLDGRVKVVHRKNGGLSAARNSGIEVARGEYYAFVDSDDWLDNQYFSLLYAECEKGAEVAECDYVLTDGKDSAAADYSVNTVTKSGKELYNDSAYYFGIRGVTACNKLYAKKCFDNNIRFTENKVSEDVFTTYKLVYPCKKVACLSAKLYYYYENQSSITRKAFNYKRLNAIEGYAEQYEYFVANCDEKAAEFAAVKVYCLIMYFYALSLRRGTQDRRGIKKFLKEYFKRFYPLFKGKTKGGRLEKLLLGLSQGHLGYMRPLAMYRRNRIR